MKKINYAAYAATTLADDKSVHCYFLLKQLNDFNWPLYFLTTNEGDWEAPEKYLFHYRDKLEFLAWSESVQNIYLDCWNHPRKKFYLLLKNGKFSSPYVVDKRESFSMENDTEAILYFKLNYDI